MKGHNNCTLPHYHSNKLHSHSTPAWMNKYALYVFGLVQLYTFIAVTVWSSIHTNDNISSLIIADSSTSMLQEQLINIKEQQDEIDHTFRKQVEAEKELNKELAVSQKRIVDILAAQLEGVKTKGIADKEKLTLEMKNLRSYNKQLSEELQLESQALGSHDTPGHQLSVKNMLHRNSDNVVHMHKAVEGALEEIHAGDDTSAATQDKKVQSETKKVARSDTTKDNKKEKKLEKEVKPEEKAELEKQNVKEDNKVMSGNESEKVLSKTDVTKTSEGDKKGLEEEKKTADKKQMKEEEKTVDKKEKEEGRKTFDKKEKKEGIKRENEEGKKTGDEHMSGENVVASENEGQEVPATNESVEKMDLSTSARSVETTQHDVTNAGETKTVNQEAIVDRKTE